MRRTTPKQQLVPTGKSCYRCGTTRLSAEGCQLSESELSQGLKRVAPILRDDAGRAGLAAMLKSLATTQFGNQQLARVLSFPVPTQDWRVGEAMAEAFLVDHRNCSFPWPSSRDLRNSNASPAGADLVGFKHEAAAVRFAFGEVKTSEEKRWPPQVMTGRHGMARQLEDLFDDSETKRQLVRYLGHHAPGAAWEADFKQATCGYLNNHEAVALFGVLIRDVEPRAEDLSSRARELAARCPVETQLELRAIYLPKGRIAGLAKAAGKVMEGTP